ncbi:lysosome-associated membrane glycoprotein 2-like [Phaethornis superciliosus]
MEPRTTLLLLMLAISGFFQSYAVEIDLKDSSNATCLYAKWMMKFVITYETNSSDYKNTTLDLSSNVTHHGSFCDSERHIAHLAVQFGNGHSWSNNYTKTNETWQGDFVTFIYNTNDTDVFPDAKRKGPITIVVKDTMNPVHLSTLFVCHSTDSVQTGNVTQIFWNVTVHPFVQNATLGKKATICQDDIFAPEPTVLPTSANVTTVTTESPAPTTPPKPMENPVTGNYSLKSGNTT